MRWWRNGVAIVVLAFLAPLGVVRGDAGLPIFVNEDFPAMRFDNLADYPDFDFYLKYAHGPGNPAASPHITPVQSGEPLRSFEGKGRIGGAWLLAVPRGQRPPTVRSDLDWLTETPAGCLQSVSLEGIHLGAGYLVPYRVHIQDGELEATMQSAEWLPLGWVVSRLPWLLCLLVPIAFCVVLGWLGARIARRLFPRKPRVAGTNP